MNLLRSDITGIDLGKKAIKIVQSSCKNSIVKIKNAAYIELPDNYSEDTFIDIALDAINRNRKISKVNTTNISLICPTEMLNSIKVTLPLMPQKELISALEWEVKKVSNLEPEMVNIDYYPNVVTNNEIKYLVYYVEKAKVDALVAKFKNYNVNLKYIDVAEMTELACFNAVYSNDGSVKGFLDVGYTQTKIVFIKNSSILFQRTLPDNLQNLYQSISAEDFEGISYKDVIVYKGLKDAKVEKIVKDFLNELVFEISRSVDYFTVTFKLTPPTNIFLSGGFFKIPGVLEFLKSSLSYPVTLNNVLDVCGYKDEKLNRMGFCFNFALGASIRR